MPIIRPIKRPLVRPLSKAAGSEMPWEGEDPSTPLVYGLRDFLTLDSYYTAPAGQGIQGSGGFWVAVLFTLEGNGSGTSYLGECGALASRGWSLRVPASSTTLIFRYHDGTAANVQAPSVVLPAAVDSLQCALAFHNGTTLELYVNRARIGSGTAITGSTPASGDAMGFGVQSATTSDWGEGNIYGMAGGDTDSPTDAEALAYFDDVKAAGDIVALAGVTTEYEWSVKRNARSVPTEFVESRGTAENLDRAGTGLVAVAHPARYLW